MYRVEEIPKVPLLVCTHNLRKVAMPQIERGRERGISDNADVALAHSEWGSDQVDASYISQRLRVYT
jgi:hypothetical protein